MKSKVEAMYFFSFLFEGKKAQQIESSTLAGNNDTPLPSPGFMTEWRNWELITNQVRTVIRLCLSSTGSSLVFLRVDRHFCLNSSSKEGGVEKQFHAALVLRLFGLMTQRRFSPQMIVLLLHASLSFPLFQFSGIWRCVMRSVALHLAWKEGQGEEEKLSKATLRWSVISLIVAQSEQRSRFDEIIELNAGVNHWSFFFSLFLCFSSNKCDLFAENDKQRDKKKQNNLCQCYERRKGRGDRIFLLPLSIFLISVKVSWKRSKRALARKLLLRVLLINATDVAWPPRSLLFRLIEFCKEEKDNSISLIVSVILVFQLKWVLNHWSCEEQINGSLTSSPST